MHKYKVFVSSHHFLGCVILDISLIERILPGFRFWPDRYFSFLSNSSAFKIPVSVPHGPVEHMAARLLHLSDLFRESLKQQSGWGTVWFLNSRIWPHFNNGGSSSYQRHVKLKDLKWVLPEFCSGCGKGKVDSVVHDWWELMMCGNGQTLRANPNSTPFFFFTP